LKFATTNGGRLAVSVGFSTIVSLVTLEVLRNLAANQVQAQLKVKFNKGKQGRKENMVV